MNTGPQRVGAAGQRAAKANKACVACRARKVKCDAAAVGLPCSICISRQCAKVCVLPFRKGRTRNKIHAVPISSQARESSAPLPDVQPNQLSQASQAASDALDRQTAPDLLYLNILHDAVKDSAESSRLRSPGSANSLTRSSPWTKLPQLDDLDQEYLAKKGVFDVLPPHYLDVLIKTYFDHVYPFAPVLNRADFIRDYQSGTCSLFLLHAMLTPASLHAPTEVLSACGFASRSAAQAYFFAKAKLLHDFAVEGDPLLQLQGSIILCTVILDHPSDRDFGYWFHNAIRLATKLDLRNTCVREDKPPRVVRLYRRIWWGLYFMDIFHVFINTRHARLLQNSSMIKLRTEDDWETEDIVAASSSLLSAVSPQQKASPVAHCELGQIFGKCLSIVTDKPQQDPRQMLRPLDAWRASLAAKMHVGGNTGTDVYYLNLQAMGYRFECILCRLIQRRWQETQHADWSAWAKQRIRSAILELDTIATRVLASGTLQDFPMSFVTTITALLALHIESALDPTETELVRSMARISISQTMLVLSRGKEIPALKRALPVFKDILAKKHLYSVPPNMDSQLQDVSMADTYDLPAEQCENDPLMYGDFLGDFLDEWQIGQLDLLVNMDE